jgi:hypothetical protein
MPALTFICCGTVCIGSAPKQLFESWTGICGGEIDGTMLESEHAICWAMKRTGVDEMEPAEFLAAFMCWCIGKTADDKCWMDMAVDAFVDVDESDQRSPIVAAALSLLMDSWDYINRKWHT